MSGAPRSNGTEWLGPKGATQSDTALGLGGSENAGGAASHAGGADRVGARESPSHVLEFDLGADDRLSGSRRGDAPVGPVRLEHAGLHVVHQGDAEDAVD